MQNKMNMENKTYKCVPENSQINLSTQDVQWLPADIELVEKIKVQINLV